MPDSARYWCVVPAAGVGRRMGTDYPKQYLKLMDKTVCEHTLIRLLGISEIEQIVVSVSPEDAWWPTLSLQNDSRITSVKGGQERCDSVLNGLNALRAHAEDHDWVIVHDVARPCVRKDDIRSLMQRTQNHSCGGILATPVRDTMKRSNPHGEIQQTVDRNGLWHALTPQLFRYGQLKQALTDALDAGQPITDEASAIEWAGGAPLLVEGHPDNIKITHPNDLKLALLYLREQHQESTSAE